MTFNVWWESRSINQRLMHLHGDRATYTEEGWNAGVHAERIRIRNEFLLAIGNNGEPHVYVPELLELLDRICSEA